MSQNGDKFFIFTLLQKYCLSYQMYFSADMVCYEGKGVPADIELLNHTSDIMDGRDPLIIRAIEVLMDGKQRISKRNMTDRV